MSAVCSYSLDAQPATSPNNCSANIYLSIKIVSLAIVALPWAYYHRRELNRDQDLLSCALNVTRIAGLASLAVRTLQEVAAYLLC